MMYLLARLYPNLGPDLARLKIAGMAWTFTMIVTVAASLTLGAETSRAGGQLDIGTSAINVGQGLTFSVNPKDPPAPLAMHGYDPVAYFAAGKPTPGSSAHAVYQDGAIYWFSSAENQKLFQADPNKYVPQYGGYCAFGVAQGTKFDGDPALWTIHGGKLYLNVNPKIQGYFTKDIAGNIAQADKNWPQVRAAKPGALFAAWLAKQKQ